MVDFEKSSKEVAKELEQRARDPKKLMAPEFYRLMIYGIAYLLREVESVSYSLHKRGC
jgi:hypothetical protein